MISTMKKNLSIAFLLCANYVFAQDTVYFDEKGKKTIDKSTATCYETKEFYGINYHSATVNTFFMSGQIKSQIEYSNYDRSIRSGKSITWNLDGQKISEINYSDNFMDGSLITYWDNGQIKRNDIYDKGKFIRGNCYAIEGKDTTHFAYEVMPQFPGGEGELFKFLRNNVKYPRNARENGISGKVYVSYIIDKDGGLRDIKIMKGVSQDLDEEAMRVIKLMPKWIPGIQDGIPVQVQYNMPINFMLQ